MTTMWRTRWNGSAAGWPEAPTAQAARTMVPSSATATIAVRRSSGAAIRASSALGVVGGDDHRLELEEVPGVRVDLNPDPVDIGATEGLQAGEVGDQVVLLDQRLV